MPLRKEISHTFHRVLFGGNHEMVTLLKRDDNQRQGVVRAIKLYECWRTGSVLKTGETIQGGLDSDHTTIWMLPMIELRRTGVNYLAPADRIVDGQGRYWQPDSSTLISVEHRENYWRLACTRIDPPPASSGLYPTEGVI